MQDVGWTKKGWVCVNTSLGQPPMSSYPSSFPIKGSMYRAAQNLSFEGRIGHEYRLGFGQDLICKTFIGSY